MDTALFVLSVKDARRLLVRSEISDTIENPKN